MVRIVIAADLHFHPRWERAMERFAQEVHDERPDCFILAGDVGHPLSNFRRGLAFFADMDCPRLVLAGNHDVWSGEHSSQALWDHLLEDAARTAGYVWLERESFHLGNLGICGTLGWYDYSARDPDLTVTEQDYFINKGMFNNDGNYVDWAYTDQEFSDQILRAFAQRLVALSQNPTISQILAVTHVPPFEENLVRKPGDFAWNFCTAYAANLTLGKVLTRFRKVTHVVSGHTHHGGHWRIASLYGFVESYVVGSDYGQPAYLVLEFPWIVVI
jgi:predicted phosphohydrolase